MRLIDAYTEGRSVLVEPVIQYPSPPPHPPLPHPEFRAIGPEDFMHYFINDKMAGVIMDEIEGRDRVDRIVQFLDVFGEWAVKSGMLTYCGNQYSEEHCRTFNLSLHFYDVCVAIAPKGTGKTTAIEAYIVNQLVVNPNTTLCVVTPRRIFAKFFCDNLNKKIMENPYLKRLIEQENMRLKIVNYLDITEKDPNAYLGGIQSIACQFNSILKTFSSTTGCPKYDILILDEFTTILRTICAENLNEQRSNVISGLVSIICNAKKIIVSDCDINDDSLKVLDHFFAGETKNIFVSQNVYYMMTKFLIGSLFIQSYCANINNGGRRPILFIFAIGYRNKRKNYQAHRYTTK
jgi:hypothetical protein